MLRTEFTKSFFHVKNRKIVLKWCKKRAVQKFTLINDKDHNTSSLKCLIGATDNGNKQNAADHFK